MINLFSIFAATIFFPDLTSARVFRFPVLGADLLMLDVVASILLFVSCRLVFLNFRRFRLWFRKLAFPGWILGHVCDQRRTISRCGTEARVTLVTRSNFRFRIYSIWIPSLGGNNLCNFFGMCFRDESHGPLSRALVFGGLNNMCYLIDTKMVHTGHGNQYVM